VHPIMSGYVSGNWKVDFCDMCAHPGGAGRCTWLGARCSRDRRLLSAAVVLARRLCVEALRCRPSAPR
jgi:hypothetical protein